MKRIRYLTILLMLLGCGIGSRAQDDFNPVSPSEPGQPPTKLTLVVAPAEGGSVSGNGRYVEGEQVSLRAYNATGFVFVGWVNSAGEIISTSSSYTYTKGATAEVLTARFDFSPDTPAEPQEIASKLYYRLSLAADTDCGSVSGGGRYLPGTEVTLRAYTNTGFVFTGWYNATGDCLSTATTYIYTTVQNNTTLTARFAFDPDSPTEPSEPILRHRITVPATDGGTTNISTIRILTGESYSLYAYPNSGYVFGGWYLNGVLYTTLQSFSYTMGTENVVFEPRFTFDPASPSEPSEATMKKFTFTLYNRACKAGDDVEFPVYLMTTDELHDMTFQLSFPKEIVPEVQNTSISENAVGYTISLSEITDPEALALPSVDENATVYTLSFIGGTLAPGNTVLLNFTIHVAETIETGQGYPVRINQVSMTLADGQQVSAATRNGRVSVYKRGDVNGDNDVNVGDLVTLMSHIVGDPTDTFIEEVANVTEGDTDINVGDVVNLMNIITDSEE